MIEEIERPTNASTDSTVSVAIEHRHPNYVVMNEDARERHIAPHSVHLGTVNVDALRVGPFDHIARNLHRPRAADFHACACAVEFWPPAGFQRMVPVDSHITEPAAKLRVTPA